MLLLVLFVCVTVASEGCINVIVHTWDNMTTYDPATSQLYINMTMVGAGGECEETAFPLYLDVFAVQDGHTECSQHRFQGAGTWKQDNWRNIKIDNIFSKMVIPFISGKFIFRIKKQNFTSEGIEQEKSGMRCTALNKYTNTHGDNIIDKIYSEACQKHKGSGAPKCQDGVLNLKKFELPHCYIQADYAMIDVFLYRVNNNTGCQSIQNWEHFEEKFKANATQRRDHLNVSDIKFSIKKSGSFCFFLSMKETYPKCLASEAGYQPKCFFSFPAQKPITCGPKLKETDDTSINVAIICVAICMPILVSIVSLALWVKLRQTGYSVSKYRHLLRSISTKSENSQEGIDENSVNTLKDLSRLILLYFPGELQDKDRDAIVGDNGALNKYCSQNRQVIVTDVCQQIEQDLIQDPGKIESGLTSGVTRCLLVLSPGIKKLFDHVSSGVMDVSSGGMDPLENMDGAWRSLMPPIVRHLLDMRNANGHMYKVVACIRFDDQAHNLGDEIEINPLKRFSLPSDAKELALWIQCT